MFTPPRITRRTALFLLAGGVAFLSAIALAPKQTTAASIHGSQTLGANQAGGAPVVTWRAINTDFDADGTFNNGPDTVTIMMGETVRWQQLVGTHTVTSGTGAADPDVGLLFDVPLDAANPIFDFTFDNAGVFPFFCRPHEVLNMRGVVIVEGSVGITPLPGIADRIGFTRSPAPNPTRGTASFRFALPIAGQATARVYDARGRLVAELLNERLEPGSYGAVWDGRDRSGNLASPGVYFVNLTLPDHRDSRRVVLSR